MELGQSTTDGWAVVSPWNELTVEQKNFESKKMEVYAAMAQAMDYNIGKVIDHLKNIGEYENTLIIFTSDNGGEAEDVYDLKLREDIVQEFNQFLVTQNNSESNLGNADSFISYGPGWAEASNTPFNGFKGFLTEGGITVPLIVKLSGESKYKIGRGFDICLGHSTNIT